MSGDNIGNAAALELVYRDTSVSTRVELDAGLKNENGERLNVVYGLLEQLSFRGSRFGVILCHADGGVNRFFVTYKFGDYIILIIEFDFGRTEWPFDSALTLADWLTDQDRRIVATATLLSTES